MTKLSVLVNLILDRISRHHLSLYRFKNFNRIIGAIVSRAAEIEGKSGRGAPNYTPFKHDSFLTTSNTSRFLCKAIPARTRWLWNMVRSTSEVFNYFYLPSSHNQQLRKSARRDRVWVKWRHVCFWSVFDRHSPIEWLSFASRRVLMKSASQQRE